MLLASSVVGPIEGVRGRRTDGKRVRERRVRRERERTRQKVSKQDGDLPQRGEETIQTLGSGLHGSRVPQANLPNGMQKAKQRRIQPSEPFRWT